MPDQPFFSPSLVYLYAFVVSMWFKFSTPPGVDGWVDFGLDGWVVGWVWVGSVGQAYG